MSLEKTSFSQTCSLLRQFLKENGSIGELSLGMSCNLDSNNTKGGFEMPRPVATTMDLFPMSEKPAECLSKSGYGPASLSGQHNSAAKEPAGAAQMTIFYAGRVVVVDDLPADKAKEIMLFAGQQNQDAFSGSNPGKERSPPAAKTVEDPTEPCNSICPASNAPAPKFGNNLMPEHVRRQSTRPIICDLPIQRKASLHRFLEKRKDRINRSAPYQTSSPYSKLAETNQSTFSKPAETNPNTPWATVERDLLGNLRR